MNAIEFTSELGPDPVLTIPKEAAAQLPKTGKARVLVLTTGAGSNCEPVASEQALRDEWTNASAIGLGAAYGQHEPEYGPDDIKR